MKKYLPLGSVVTLKKSEKKMMIIGRSQMCCIMLECRMKRSLHFVRL